MFSVDLFKTWLRFFNKNANHSDQVREGDCERWSRVTNSPVTNDNALQYCRLIEGLRVQQVMAVVKPIKHFVNVWMTDRPVFSIGY